MIIWLIYKTYFQGNPLSDIEYKRIWQERLAEAKLAETSSPQKLTELTNLVSARQDSKEAEKTQENPGTPRIETEAD